MGCVPSKLVDTLLLLNNFSFLCICVYSCIYVMRVGDHKDQKKTLGLLELELQMIESLDVRAEN